MMSWRVHVHVQVQVPVQVNELVLRKYKSQDGQGFSIYRRRGRSWRLSYARFNELFRAAPARARTSRPYSLDPSTVQSAKTN